MLPISRFPAGASARKTALVFLTAALNATMGSAQLVKAQQPAPTGGAAAAPTAFAAAAERAPIIDGSAEDAVWQSAQIITGFRAFDPKEDGDPAFPTEAKIAYDAENLYVFARMYDPHPDSIVSLLSRRDVKTQSEQIKVMIDSYHDRRTAYEFAVNPAGVRRDYYEYNDSQEDITWDAVWDVATRIDSLGWTAEFRIPLSQIRYPRAAEHTFGIMIMRDIVRRGERDSWPVYAERRAASHRSSGIWRGCAGSAHRVASKSRRTSSARTRAFRNRAVGRGPRSRRSAGISSTELRRTSRSTRR